MLKTFKVTKEILALASEKISNGAMLSTNCVIAEAIKAGGYEHVSMGGYTGHINHKLITFPNDVVNYASIFDNGTSEERLNLPEFEFQLEVPDAV